MILWGWGQWGLEGCALYSEALPQTLTQEGIKQMVCVGHGVDALLCLHLTKC